MSNQEHVCIAITKSNMGGAQKYVLTLAQGLAKNGKKVSVIAGGDGPLITSLKESGIPVFQLKNSDRDISILKEFKLMKELYTTLDELAPDILHLNSSKLGVLGAVAGRLAGIKRIIFTAHGWAFNEARPAYQKWIFYVLYWITIGMCDMTICVSKKTRAQITVLPFMENKTTVTYNGITQPNFYDRAAARAMLAEKNQQLDPAKRWIVVLAELHYTKGHDLLIETLSNMRHELQNCQFVMVGSGEQEAQLKSMVIRKNLEKYVFFTGFLAEGSRYLKAFDLSILPSRTEALPLSILEAGLSETLVLASNVGGIPEIINDSVSGFLFEREDTNDLHNKLSHILSLSKKDQLACTNNLKEKISREFSLENMLSQTEAVYKK